MALNSFGLKSKLKLFDEEINEYCKVDSKLRRLVKKYLVEEVNKEIT